MHILSRTAALVLCLAAAPLAAQARPLAPGDAVRFSPEPRGVWRVERAGADSLVVRNADGVSRPVASTEVVIRRAVGKNRLGSAVRGLLYGMGAGAVFGAAIGYAQGDDPPDVFLSFTAEENALFGAVAFGALGTIAGTVVGIVAPRSRWEVVSSGSSTTSVTLQVPDGRPGVLLSVSF
jgi:hypothetical protein